MINCKQATERVSQQLDGTLPWNKHLGLRLHLLICHYCRNYARHLNFIRRAAAGIERHIETHGPGLSPAGKEKIRQRIESSD